MLLANWLSDALPSQLPVPDSPEAGVQVREIVASLKLAR